MNQNIGVRLQMIVFISVISCYFYIFLWHYKPLGTPSAPSRIAYLDIQPIQLFFRVLRRWKNPHHGGELELNWPGGAVNVNVFSDLR